MEVVFSSLLVALRSALSGAVAMLPLTLTLTPGAQSWAEEGGADVMVVFCFTWRWEIFRDVHLPILNAAVTAAHFVQGGLHDVRLNMRRDSGHDDNATVSCGRLYGQGYALNVRVKVSNAVFLPKAQITQNSGHDQCPLEPRDLLQLDGGCAAGLAGHRRHASPGGC